jgi:acyl-CoA thioester hydrolase
MFTHQTHIRVRYAETDQMGYVYYGNYAQYFETGRVEALRSLGYTYRNMEENGVMMPVTHMKTDFIKPALYDDLLTVKTIISTLPTVRMYFTYEITNEAGILLAVGETTLVFVNRATQRPMRCPDFLYAKLEAFIKSK